MARLVPLESLPWVGDSRRDPSKDWRPAGGQRRPAWPFGRTLARVTKFIRGPEQPWWAPLSHDPVGRRAARRLEMLGRPRVFAAGRTVFEAGDRADGFYFIESGRVAITKQSREHPGVGVPVAMLEAGEFFGEVATLYEPPSSSDGPRELTRNAGAQTAEATRLRVLRRFELDILMELAPGVAVEVAHKAVGRAVATEPAMQPA